jgi:hypothetical protein
MGDWPLASGFRAESFGTSTATQGGTTVTGGATAHTKGSWVQLDASTSFDATVFALYVVVQFQDTLYLLDVGIGAAGSEQVIVPNFLISQSVGLVSELLLPIGVPAGSRVAVRCQDNFGSSNLYVTGMLYSGGWGNDPTYQTMTAYGVNTAASNGTIVDAGAVANTKGSWTQIVASTTTTMKAFMMSAIRPAPATSITADFSVLADVGVGASGSEQALLSNMRYFSSIQTGGVITPYTAGSATLSGLSTLVPRIIPPVPCDISQGVRLAVRQQATTTNANDRKAAYAIYGLN